MMLVKAKSSLLSRLKSLTSLQRFNHTLTEEGLQAQVYPEMGSDSLAQQNYVLDMSKWRRINAGCFGLTRSMIPNAPYTVLKLLRVGGFEAYLVGGCVRDLLLNKVPKDFDVITTAELKQIKKTFYRAEIIGHRFPICKVHVKGSVIEVSSFGTLARCSEEKEKVLSSQMPSGCNGKDFLRWRNSMHRDFTINSLFFDPFVNQIYDYANGMADLRSLKLRTLIPAQLSFQEDCARILRGVRIAGRLGLSISKDTDTAIRKLSSSIMSLSKSRILMELNYMLSYGAAESTIHLLQKFNLLEIFLPFHAAYLHHQASEISSQSSMMLMKLFFNLDKMVSSDRPCDCNLWVGLLAFHQALVLCPQDASVIWVLASMLYRGTWEEGVKFARENAKLQDRFVPEISGFSEIASDNELTKQVSHLVALVQDAVVAFTEESSLCRSMSRYPDSTFHDMVFVPKKIGGHVCHLFDMSFYENIRESFKINYDLLGKGNLHETRFVLGKVILETLSGGLVGGGIEIIKEKPGVTEIIKEKPGVTEIIKEKPGVTEITKEKHRVVKKNNGPKLSNLIKDGLVVKEDIEHVLLSFDFEPNQKRSKKQKKEKMECFPEKEINSIKEEVVVLKDASEEMAKKHQKIVDTSQLCEEKPSPPQRESDRKCVSDGSDKYQHRDKRHKKVQKVKHQELDDKETIELFNAVKDSSFCEDGVNKGEEKDNLPPVLQVVVKQETKKLKKVLVKENSGRPSLSSLFKR